MTRFGYLKSEDGTKLIPNLEEYRQTGKTYWEIARELVDTFLEVGNLSGTIRKMCQKYGADRVSHLKHEDFPHDHKALKQWLQSEQIRGNIAYFPKDKQKKVCLFNKHKALISPEEDLQINRLLQRNERLKGKADTCLNPLAGLIFCAGCGSPMKAKTSNGYRKWHYVVCSGAYPIAAKPKTCDRRSAYSLEVPDVSCQMLSDPDIQMLLDLVKCFWI